MTAIKPPVTNRRKRRWFTVGGLLLVALLIWPAYRQYDKYLRYRQGMEALSTGEFAKSVEVLESAVAAYPGDAELAFFAAIAHRRNNDLEKFESALARAERLGSSPDQLRLQRILAWTQHGLGTRETEEELNRVCMQGTDDFTAEQIYEARAKGFMSLFQLIEALRALDHWIAWKPQATVPRLLRAEVYEQIHHNQNAENDYLAIVRVEPDNVEARLRYARFLLLAQKHDASLAEFKLCERALPGDPRVVLGLAEIELLTGGDLESIEKQLTEMLASKITEKDRRLGLMYLANIYVTRKEYDKVVTLLAERGAQRQLDIPTYQTLSRAYAGLGERELAQQYRQLVEAERDRRHQINRLNESIVRSPSDPDLRHRQAQLYWEGGNKEAAVTWWYTAVLADPLHQPSHEALASYYMAQGNAERATYHAELAERSVERTFALAWEAYVNNDFATVREKQAAIAKYPSYKHYVELLDYGVEVKEKQREFDPAHLEPLRSLTQYPRMRDQAMTVLGAALLHLDRAGPAEQLLLEVIRNDPKAIEAHRWMTALCFDIRALDHATYHCDQVAELDPQDYRPHRLLGAIGKMLQSFDKAIASYQEALRREPGERVRQEILLEMADCQLRVLKADEALKTIDQATESLLANLLRAKAYLATGRTDEAKELLDRVLEKHPDEWMAHGLRADVAIAQQDSAAAAHHLEQLVAVRPFDDSGWVKLSQAYTRLNDRKKAEQALAKANRLRPIQAEYSELIDEAVTDAFNVEIREKMASLARQLGEEDLAAEWDRAVALMKSRVVPPPVGKEPVPTIIVPGAATPPKVSAELSTLRP